MLRINDFNVGELEEWFPWSSAKRTFTYETPEKHFIYLFIKSLIFYQSSSSKSFFFLVCPAFGKMEGLEGGALMIEEVY